MEDQEIVELFWNRDEKAIDETAKKYGNFCYSIAYKILSNHEDSEESVNDTYIDAWNSIPPHKPEALSSFLGKITRRIAIDRWRINSAEKRGGGETALVLDELEECISNENDIETDMERKLLVETLNAFLGTLSVSERKVFVCRYFYMDSVESVSEKFGFSKGKVKSMLFRTREKLRVYLQKEGF
ncbi:MAG: sigma-70 family RNA polymerase sigma factor [Clostridia bacterium]|nr:sigma-70 family RNA polymerase sigma factor [Clostridia bacterium]